jgi:hypothetical protein
VSVVQTRIEADLLSLTYIDLLILIGVHLIEIADEVQCDLGDGLLESIADFWKDAVEVKTSTDHASTAVSAGASVNVGLKGLLSLFTNLSSELRWGMDRKMEIRETVRRNTSQWINLMTEASMKITNKLSGKQPIIVFEDLSELEPDQARELFKNPLTQMPFPIIYTASISMMFDPEFSTVAASFSLDNCHTLPMIKVRNIDHSEYFEGIDLIKGIVNKRAENSLFDDDALTYLIKKTGGVLRDLFYCIKLAASRADTRRSEQIEIADAEFATRNLSSSLTRRIDRSDYGFLVDIHDKEASRSDIADTQMMLRMMQAMAVLEYNGDRWHDLHPLIEDFLSRQGALNGG